ncbi:MAG: hypothetical protein Q9214_001404 [Letrouitia sp. 1 TL-2023]
MGRRGIPPEEFLERAEANGYKQGAHQAEDSIEDNTKYVKKTLKDQNWALGRYEKEGLPPLDLATIKDFLRFHVAISRGRVDDERITVDSVNTFTEWYFAGFARVTGNLIDKEDRRAVYDWTRNTLAMEGLVVNKKKQKHLFGEKELVQFNATFWTIDDAQFIYPRNKAQVPFAIAVFYWTRARIGAFFPNQENKDKGGPSIPNKAFWGIDSPKDFWQLRIPPADNELLLQWTESAKRLPILRNATMQQGVSEEPLSKKTFDRIIKSVLNSSGYFGNAIIYAIRRYLGKKVNSQSP